MSINTVTDPAGADDAEGFAIAFVSLGGAMDRTLAVESEVLLCSPGLADAGVAAVGG